MFQKDQDNSEPRSNIYSQLAMELDSLFESETNFIANSANMSSLLYHRLPEINWSGFYLKQNNQLVLGPFHGKPACVRINMGDGVCGKAAESQETVMVKDVHKFPGHIVCDPDSKSEIVVPMIKNNHLFGVLDIDSPISDRFNHHDQNGLETLVSILLNACA